MAIWHLRSKRKITGGKLKPYRKKKRRERGRDFIPVRIGERKFKIIRTTGGNKKVVLLRDSYANVKVNNDVKRAKILRVIENPANPQYARQNIITKGAIIETELGRARVTSRPSQHGIVNAILIEKSGR